MSPSDDQAPRSAATPPRIRLGDTIGVIAPSGAPLAEALQRGLKALAGAFTVKVARSALAPTPPPHARYLAASDAERAHDTNEMLADPDVRAIIMARGGYGLHRILPELDARALRADPKPIVGFSDGTALLAWAWENGMRGIHGEVVVRIGSERPEAVDDLVRVLTDPRPLGRMPWSLHSASDQWDAANATPVVTAPMFPANLAMACHLVGTPWQLPLSGATWWLEDVGARPYEIDRYLTHMKLAGQLHGLAGVVVGDLVRCMDPLPEIGDLDDPRAALAVVRDRFSSCGVPVLYGASFGHGRYNPPIPFGARCTFDPASALVEILDGAVT